jgi:PAS domain S-box-containing protein
MADTVPAMKKNSLLARRLAARVVVFGCLLTLAASYIQIRIEAARDKADILDDLARVMYSSQGVLEESLWQMDMSSVRLILEGISHQPGVHYVAVTAQDGQVFSVGATLKGETVRRELPLTHNYNGEAAPLGTLAAEADFAAVDASLAGKTVLILGFQALLIFGVAAFILAAHYRMIGRHVHHIVGQLAGRGIDDLDEPVDLDRKPEKQPDELDLLVSTIRRMLSDTARSIRAERASTEQLEEEIGRRQDVECALSESEKRYQTLFEHAADSILIIDPAGRVLGANRAACANLGYTREELLTMSLADIDTPESLALVPERFARLRREGSVVVETDHRRKDGSALPVEVHARTIDYGGSPAFLAICRDITERRKSASRLVAQNRYLTCHLRVSELALTAGGESELCRMICEEIARTLDYPMVAVEAYDPAREVMVFDGVSEHFGIGLPFEVPAGETVSGTVARTGKAVVESDVSGRGEYRNKALRALGTKTFLCFPMRCQGTVIGALSMASNKVESVDAELITWAGSMANYVAALLDHKRSEYRVTASLREKDILLREIHHRVKNNLQIVSSLLRLQAYQITDPAALEYIEESQSRVMAMALVHEDLYQTSDLSLILVPEFFTRLTQRILSAFGRGRDIECPVEAEDTALSIDTVIPLGLIVNELAVNALKHAFADRERGVMTVRFFRQGDDYVLTVSDNGRGLPPGFDMDSASTLGMQLVASLAEQLRGQISAHNQNGAEFVLRFPKSS